MSEPHFLKVARQKGLILRETSPVFVEKPSKFRNRKVEMDGHKFDSKKEADRYAELVLFQKRGWVRNLRLQVTFPIVINGVKVCKYIADFVYDEVLPDGEFREVIEDVKSEFTRKNPVYRLKRKLLLAVCGRAIREA